MAAIPAETPSIMTRPWPTGGCRVMVDSSWNVMAHGDAREGKWSGNWLMQWVASTLHTTSEHVVSSITTADAHTSAASSRLNWRPRRFKWFRPFSRKTKSGFCACAITFQLASKRNKFLYLRYCAFFCHIVIVKSTKTEFVRNFMKNFLFGSESKQRHSQFSDGLRLSLVSSLGQHKVEQAALRWSVLQCPASANRNHRTLADATCCVCTALQFP